ncbi:MAG: immunoglobulin domain-containing protein, partial [Limisphaerales bacterium]
LSNVVAIAAGENFCLALQRNGHVAAWGYDIAGETVPPVGLSNVVAISAGWAFSLALTNNGSPFFVNQMPNPALYSEASSVMNFDGVKWQLFCPAQNVFAGSTVALNTTVVSGTPASMQWQFAGIDIPGATNSVLIVTNVQPITQGAYTLSTSNAVGTTTTLAVNFSVTFINAQPSSQTVLDGGSVTFSVGTVPASDPYTYYWYYETTNLIQSGTNSILNIPAVSTNDAGRYSVVVSNSYGTVTSDVASLTVIPAIPPQIISADAQFGFFTDGFSFNIRGASGQTIVVEGSTDFLSWTPLVTNLIGSTNFFYFSDQTSSDFPCRFYRAKLQ